MNGFYSKISAACDRAAQTVSRTALLSMGVIAASLPQFSAQALPHDEAIQYEAIKIAAVDAVPLLRPSGSQLQDGKYLFGESSLPDQVNRAYMVFEVKNAKVSGAVYWPHSSYDCFEGRFNQEQLALRVKAAYTGEVYTHALGLEPIPTTIASSSAVAEPGLEGMHRFDDLTENHERMLTSCQAVL